MTLRVRQCPRVHSIQAWSNKSQTLLLQVGDAFSWKHSETLRFGQSFFFFECCLLRISKECDTFFPLPSTSFLPSHHWFVSLRISAVPLTVYVLLGGASLQLAASSSSPLREPHVLLPAARQTHELGDRKWRPISYHLCAVLFFKALGIRLTFQLWMCVCAW